MFLPRPLRVMCLLATMGQATAFAASTFKSHSTENEWNSAQINALGGVGSMSEDFVDQFFSDPSLAADEKRSFVFQLSNVNVMYSKDLSSTVQEFQAFAKESSASDNGSSSDSSAQIVSAFDKVRALFGRRLTGGMNLALLAFQVKGFSFVPYASGLVDGGINVPSWPRASMIGDAYVGLGIGYAMKLPKGFSLGLNVRPGVRAYAKIEADASSVGGFSTSGTQGSGSGSAASSGFAPRMGAGFYLPVDMGLGFMPLPSLRFSLVARDTGGAPSLSTLQGDAPPTYPMRLSLGLNYAVLEIGTHKVNFGSELQDLLYVKQDSGLWYRWQWAGQYLYRLPFRSQTSFGLNAGLQSGYPAVGVFLDFVLFKLDATYHTRETGLYIGQRPQKCYSFRAHSQMSF